MSKGLFAFEMTGLDEAAQRLAHWRRALEDENALREIMIEAATPILDRIRGDLPRLTGRTAKDLVINADLPGGLGVVRVEIGARRRAFILRYLEFGTSKMAARPVIRGSWDAEREAYVGRVVAGVRRRMNG